MRKYICTYGLWHFIGIVNNKVFFRKNHLRLFTWFIPIHSKFSWRKSRSRRLSAHAAYLRLSGQNGLKQTDKKGKNVQILRPFEFWLSVINKMIFCLNSNYLLRVQSFTSLKADLRQDINGGFAISIWLNGTFPWGKCSVKRLW